MTKKIKIVSLIAALLVVILAGGFCFAYFVLQLPVFDRGGWHTTEAGVVQYRDYYARPLTGWQTIDEKTYHFGVDGALDTGWLDLEGKRYYLREDGTVHTGWLEENGNRYYLSEDGSAYIGWLDLDGQRFFADSEGKLVTDGWLEQEEGAYYLDANGNPCTGWTTVDGLRYYLDESGLRDPNWQDTDSGLTYLENGQRYVGWLERPEGRFYFDSDGFSQNGWIVDETARYYLYEDGTLATGFVEIGGIERYFLPTGEYIVLCNRQNPVPEDYEVNLVKVGDHEFDSTCAQALTDMFDAAKKAGLSVRINDAYRSWEYQQAIWDKRKKQYMSEGMTAEEADAEVGRLVALPGTSGHQTGLAVDVGSTKEGHQWLANNGWKYGFILRYPEGKEEITGLDYEPWHFQ